MKLISIILITIYFISIINGMPIQKPKKIADITKQSIILTSSLLVSSLSLPSISNSKMENIIGDFRDETYNYKCTIYPGWTSIKKTGITPSLEKVNHLYILNTK